MDELIKKIAGLGLPGIILLILIGTQGSSVAAIATLAGLGGPLGIVGGLGLLGLAGVAGDLIAGSGLENILKFVYEERSKNESTRFLIKEIKDLPITDELKIKIEEYLLSKKSESDSEASAEPRTVEIVDE